MKVTKQDKRLGLTHWTSWTEWANSSFKTQHLRNLCKEQMCCSSPSSSRYKMCRLISPREDVHTKTMRDQAPQSTHTDKIEQLGTFSVTFSVFIAFFHFGQLSKMLSRTTWLSSHRYVSHRNPHKSPTTSIVFPCSMIRFLSMAQSCVNFKLNFRRNLQETGKLHNSYDLIFLFP